MKPTTLKELAEILDLSTSTVSKALKNKSDISTQTKLRVKEMAKECGYVPNFLAQNLRYGKTKIIGVVMPNVLNDFFAMVFHGIEKEALKFGYRVILCVSNDQSKKEKNSLMKLINGSVDGLLISLASETQCLNKKDQFQIISENRIPVVLSDRVFEDVQCDTITIDDFDGAYQATKYLIDTGCKKIAFLNPISETSVGELRKEGYLQALRLENNNDTTPIIIAVDNYDNLEVTMQKAIAKYHIDAILAADEFSAVCVMNMVQAWGLKVPDDISIIGFTDGKFSKYSNPPLTTVSQNCGNIGRIAVKTLVRRMEKGVTDCPTHTVIRTSLAVRGSTKGIQVGNCME